MAARSTRSPYQSLITFIRRPLGVASGTPCCVAFAPVWCFWAGCRWRSRPGHRSLSRVPAPVFGLRFAISPCFACGNCVVVHVPVHVSVHVPLLQCIFTIVERTRTGIFRLVGSGLCTYVRTFVRTCLRNQLITWISHHASCGLPRLSAMVRAHASLAIVIAVM